MAQLQIALQEGFADDEVVVFVDDREVYRRNDVTTRMQIGLADSFEVELRDSPAAAPPGTPSHIRVTVRGIEATADVRPEETPYIAVSISDNVVEIRASMNPFGYL
jgi:hypothetical protein